MCPTEGDFFRIHTISRPQDYRTDYRRDYARVLHSPSFRRLEHKTQLFPGHESDFFRNRLTHSLEVAQIAKSIALKLQYENPNLDVEPDVCEIAGLLHDLGHPPFGHNGEKALDSCMVHFGGFEGNAQTLRIIAKLEKKEDVSVSDGKDNRVGLNLTARVIASILKYDHEIPISRNQDSKLIKGYYHSEGNLIRKIKTELLGSDILMKTIECSIMDLADDIAYSTYDIEDAFKAGFLTPYEMMSANNEIFEQIVQRLSADDIKVTKEQCRSLLFGVFADTWDEHIGELKNLDKDDPLFETKALALFLSSYDLSRTISSNGYERARLTSHLIDTFVNGIRISINEEHPILSKVYFTDDIKVIVNILKHFAYVALISSSRLKVVENRGQEIIRKMFDRLANNDGYILLPDDFRELYLEMREDTDKKRVICDFIAGMTDRYALEFYGRLYSENPQTIFKPL